MSSRLSETGTAGPWARALARRALVGASTLALAVAVFAGPGVGTAAADPPLTIAEAKTQVDQLEMDAAALDEDATAVKVKLNNANRQLVMKQEDVRQQTAKVARIRKQVGQVALAQFQNRNIDTTAQLFLTSDTDGFLNQMSTVEKISENQNTILQDYQASQARLADLERSAKVDAATLRTRDNQLSSLRAASAAKIAESKAVLARLTEEERQRIAEEDAAVAAAAQKAAEDAALANASTLDPASTDPTGTGTGGSLASGKGAVAVAYAKKQLGKPYVWGATGPNAFDCSGLTSAAWRAAGVAIPRVSRAQSTGAGASVARADLQPGDLVFFYSPVSHVGIYVGNDTILHAPRPGKSVTYTSLSSMPYAGARRPG